MNGYIVFWSVVILFSLLSFVVMSIIMLTKGIPELKDMFKQLSDRNMNEINENE